MGLETPGVTEILLPRKDTGHSGVPWTGDDWTGRRDYVRRRGGDAGTVNSSEDVRQERVEFPKRTRHRRWTLWERSGVGWETIN